MLLQDFLDTIFPLAQKIDLKQHDVLFSVKLQSLKTVLLYHILSSQKV
ncbi:hypothetical protein SPHINGO8BC_90021 [Sphingobacterium multivorum]|uniref:Transposase n=1 Tax=Sphingobacterium multivorum TaxID=28454 RepID=A0A654DQN4_SPHMU|nr:hypothetical protein SPHINGO8BC_90021 [Sphingobacterium multivorum]